MKRIGNIIIGLAFPAFVAVLLVRHPRQALRALLAALTLVVAGGWHP